MIITVKNPYINNHPRELSIDTSESFKKIIDLLEWAEEHALAEQLRARITATTWLVHHIDDADDCYPTQFKELFEAGEIVIG